MLHVQTITFGPTSLAVASSQREPAEKRRPWPFNLWTLANARNDAAGSCLARFHDTTRRIEHVRRRGELPEAAIPGSDGLWTETGSQPRVATGRFETRRVSFDRTRIA